MKKSNFTTFLILLIACIGVLTCSFKKNSNKENSKSDVDYKENVSTIENNETENVFSKDENVKNDVTDNTSDLALPNSRQSLFIGDSRTVGIMEYAALDNADFFCDTGMSLFNIYDKRISVYKIGKVTLNELLSNKKYDNIYVMLGINELGYKFEKIVNNYGNLLEFIKTNQPQAKIFIEANLHVSQKRSESDAHINNAAVDKLNSELSKFADNVTTFYIDANSLFDDSNGNLSADKTADDAHLYAKYYTDWGKWICNETDKYVKEG